MKPIFAAAGLLMACLSSSALADDAMRATCQVRDANGNVLEPTAELRGSDSSGMWAVGGVSDVFHYDLTAHEDHVVFVLEDKMNGGKVVVKQTTFAVGDTVTVFLESEAESGQGLTLECVGS